jgi:glycosyltransferase involved in cell wall biosynthesis
MKGTEAIEPVLERLVRAGRIRYRPLRNVPNQDMPSVLAEADIMLDQFAIGSYGVAAVEALAAGRVVIGHVRPEVRHRVQQDTGWSLPIVEGTPATLEQVIEALLADRSAWQDQALLGPAFVQDVHDGRRSAAILDDFLLAPGA